MEMLARATTTVARVVVVGRVTVVLITTLVANNKPVTSNKLATKADAAVNAEARPTATRHAVPGGPGSSAPDLSRCLQHDEIGCASTCQRNWAERYRWSV